MNYMGTEGTVQAQKSQGWSRALGGCGTPQSSRSPPHTSLEQAQQAPLAF